MNCTVEVFDRRAYVTSLIDKSSSHETRCDKEHEISRTVETRTKKNEKMKKIQLAITAKAFVQRDLLSIVKSAFSVLMQNDSTIGTIVCCIL